LPTRACPTCVDFHLRPRDVFASARENGTIVTAGPGVTVSKYAGQTGAYQVVFPQNVTNCVAIANIGESIGNGTPGGEATSRTNGHAVPSFAQHGRCDHAQQQRLARRPSVQHRGGPLSGHKST